MITLKRNGKGNLVEAKGLRSRKSSIYTPGQTDKFKISRTKFNDFLTCQKCFYLDRVGGLISPQPPPWRLNETTDLLLKREFDVCREKQIPHKSFEKFGLENTVPYQHESIELWRDSMHHGLSHQVENSNIILHGGIDDIWFNLKQQKLLVVDYKSQANNNPVVTENYLANPYHGSYKIQLEFYAYLLTKMGFDVLPTGYFYVCNADRRASSFNGLLSFEETIVPYDLDITWIEPKVFEMISTLNSDEIPKPNPSCENCAYAHQRSLSN